MTACRLIHGDAIDVLRRLPDGVAQTCVTSPPYFGLRDYGSAGQIGLEATPDEYVARLVEVFRGVRRVLRDDGTLWLNLGDSYNNAGSSRNGEGLDGNRRGGATGPDGELGYKKRDNRRAWRDIGIKAKDLIGTPWMVAFAMRADGWYLRQDIVWNKPAPMPESVTDRCTKAHEYVFLLAKSERYFCDMEAIKEAATMRPQRREVPHRHESAPGLPPHTGFAPARDEAAQDYESRNKRSVWTVNTKPYKGAHFAVMPESLVEPCVMAGTSERGCCPRCRAPWVRRVERERVATRPGIDTKVTGDTMVDGNRDPERHVTATRTTGWGASCGCPEAQPVPCLVLEPFAGSGTVCAVSMRLGRNSIGIDLSREYLKLAEARVREAGAEGALFDTPVITVEED